MGNIIGQPLEGYVANQINARQVLHGSGVKFDQNQRNPDQINILNSNTAWVKLASGVFIDSEERLKTLGFTPSENANLKGMGLAKKYVLYSGVSQWNNGTLSTREGFRTPDFESVYKDGKLAGAISRDTEDSSYIYSRNLTAGNLHSSDAGYAPMPGIISAEIKALNRGSLEKAFIKIKAQNRQQLDIIDALYMRLGYTVLLEWGNSLYTDDGVNKKVVRNTIIEDKFFQIGNKRSYLDFLGLPKGKNVIESYRIKYSGNYDGMLAVISNFSWTFNPDGSYDIDLTLISLGDVIESLKTNLSVNSSYRTFINNNSNLNNGSIIEKGKDLNSINTMLWLWTINEPSTDVLTIKFGNGTTRKVGSFLNPGPNSLVDIEAKYDYYEVLDGEEYLIEEGKTFKSQSPDDDADEYLRQRFKDKYVNDEFRSEPSISGNYKKRVIKGTIKHSGIWVADETLLGINPETERALELFLQTNIPNPTLSETELIVQRILFYKRTSYVPDSNSTISNPLKTAPYHAAFVFNTTTPNYYLRFDYLLQYLQENIIPEINSDGGNAPLFNLDYDRWHNYMYSLPNQFSVDPGICLVRNDKFDKGPKGTASVLPELSYFRVIDNGKSTNPNVAYPLNIYLNFEFIKSSLSSNLNDKGDVNIYGFISTICTGLNRALGGINNLEPVIDKDNNTLKIIDSTPIPGISSPTNANYLLRLYGYKGSNYQESFQSYTDYVSNFIRNIDLKTSITPEYATMVTVGATANGYVKGTEATAFSVWNRGLTDRFKQELVTPEESSTVPENEAETNYFDEFLDKPNECYGIDGDLWNTGVLGDLSKDIIGKNVSTVTEFYKYLIAKKGKNTTQAGTMGFVPFKLGITMDGISGIKIYNKLNVDSSFLPVRYGDTLNFIITGVNHRLQNNDWETILETIVMPKTSQIDTIDINFTNLIREEQLEEIGNANPTIFTSGNGILPIKNLIVKYESGGDYEIYNTGQSGLGGASRAIKLTDKTAKQINEYYQRQQKVEGKNGKSTICNPKSQGKGNMFAVGKYQYIPCTLKSLLDATGLGNQLFDATTQEKLADYQLLTSKPATANYLKGTNDGNAGDLAKAVQAIAKEWAALPCIWNPEGTQVGSVQVGGGNVSYYGGKGANHKSTRIKVADVVQALIKSRIQYSNKTPSYIPKYYKS